MFRKLRPFIVLATLWFVGDRLGAFAIGSILDHSHEPIAQLYGGRAAAKIVVLGNSRAYRNIDLDSFANGFGGRVISLALPGASMEVSRALFEDYVDRYGPPSILVVELSALFSDPSSLKDLRTYAGRSERIDQLLAKHFPRLYYGGLVSKLFNYDSHYTLNTAHKVIYPMPDQLLDGSFKAEEPFAQGRYFVPLDDNIVASRKLMDMLRRCQIDVRLLLSPVVPGYASANKIDLLRMAIRDISNGVRVWDLADNPPTDEKMFFDPSHLNRQGVHAFMQMLASEGFFSDISRETKPKRPCDTEPDRRAHLSHVAKSADRS